MIDEQQLEKIAALRERMVAGADSLVIESRSLGSIVIAHSHLQYGKMLSLLIGEARANDLMNSRPANIDDTTLNEVAQAVLQLSNKHTVLMDELSSFAIEKPGSRRGRNIKPDTSRKAKYSKARN